MAGRCRPPRTATLGIAAAGVLALLLAGVASGHGGGPRYGQPVYETGTFAHDPNQPACTGSAYPDCRKLQVFSPPYDVTPGNNQAILAPVSPVEKPQYDGYVVRSQPDIVSPDGTVPDVDVVHLHHGVWLSYPEYGSAPQFSATGEEKTIFTAPPGYGLPVRSTDVWLALLMLHNAGTRTQRVHIYNEIDYVPKAAAERQGIKPLVPIWLDVKRGTERNNYPVFNVKRGFGARNPKTGRAECAYPRDTCADEDPWGEPQPGNGKGWDYSIRPEEEGTLVFAGGHVHPGGLRVEMSVIREIGGREVERPIFTSEAEYFDPAGPLSWDLAMTVTRPDWKVQVKAGDRLRINGVYEAERADWYESMAIMVATVSPGDRSGVDPFEKVRVKSRKRKRSRSKGRSRSRKRSRPKRRSKSRKRSGSRKRKSRRRKSKRPRFRYRWIPTTGLVSHGPMGENQHYGGEHERPLPHKEAAETDTITIANFQYLPGDLATAAADGIPRVKAGRPLRVWNPDSALGILHTLTPCRQPCTGTTGARYPLADDEVQLDTGELGYSPDYGPARGAASYEFTPADRGMKAGETYTYFCRIHPFMRGALKVVE